MTAVDNKPIEPKPTPSPNGKKSDLVKNALIGLFIIGAIIMAIWLILFLKPSVGDGKQTLYVRFSNIAGLSKDTRVTFAGRPIGIVKEIKEVEHARQEPTDSLGRIFFYQLTLKIDSHVKVYNTDEITIQTTGLLGEKTVAIIPKAPPKGVTPKLLTKDMIIYADSIDPLENALHNFSVISEKVENLVGDLDQWFSENRDDISEAITSFGGAMQSLDGTLTSIQQNQMIEKTTAAIDSFHNNMNLIENTLTEMQETDTVGRFNSLMDSFTEVANSFNIQGKQVLQNLGVITTDIADGSGTLGKIIKSDDLYLRVNSIMTKVNTLMNDLNHYGLLFQYDKHWQRTRTKRANMLNALDTPKEFRNFFESEIDSINTALARLTVLLEKAGDSCEKAKIMDSDCFKKDFLMLMRRVEDLYDNLKIYNEHLIDTCNEKCQ